MILRHKTRLHIRIDKDVRNFIDATGLNTDSNLNVAGLYTAEEVRMALHFFVSGLKGLKDTGQTQTVWERMKAIYVFIGGTDLIHKFNLKDPRDLDIAFRLSFLGGGWVHSSTGSDLNGTSSYANTFLNPSIILSISSTHLSHYTNENTSTGNNNEFEIGAFSGTVDYFSLSTKRGNNEVAYGSSNSTGSDFHISSTTNSIGLTLGTFNGSLNLFKNGNKVVASSIASFGNILPNSNISIGAINQGTYANFSNKRCLFSSIGDGLTDLESVVYSQLVNNLQSTLKRNPFYS